MEWYQYINHNYRKMIFLVQTTSVRPFPIIYTRFPLTISDSPLNQLNQLFFEYNPEAITNRHAMEILEISK